MSASQADPPFPAHHSPAAALACSEQTRSAPSTRRARTDPAPCAQYVPTRSAAPSTCEALLRRLCCSRSAPRA
eukprot:1180266-Prymnesium_polylepis.1